MNRHIQFFFILYLIFTLNAGAKSSIDSASGIAQNPDSTDLLNVFSARIKENKVYLNWKLTNPKNISYFTIQRMSNREKEFKALEDAERISKEDYDDKIINTKTLKVFKYVFEDEPENDGVFYYRLLAFSSGGQLMFQSDDLKIGISGVRNFILEQNRPNPFNPSTIISFELFADSYVKLKVYDLIGREIVTLVDKFYLKGEYSVEFDASKYSNIPSGIYFYKLDTEKYSEVKKMILTK